MSKTCYISAPFGLNLGELPSLLASRNVSWDWASDETLGSENYRRAIQKADMFIGVLNRTKADYRVVHEAGIAAGLDKNILLILTPALKLPIDLSLYSVARAPLSDRTALAFHLDAFLASPKRSIFEDRDTAGVAALEPTGRSFTNVGTGRQMHSDIERQLCDVLTHNEVSYVAEPLLGDQKRFRPDFLVWLGSQDPELLDPAVIEVKVRVERGKMHVVEQQLMKFMNAAGARSGIIVTQDPAPERKQQGWPNVFWLDIATISHLINTSELGSHLRKARNRAAHGSR